MTIKNQPATPLPWKSSHPMNIDAEAHRTGLIRVDGELRAVAQMNEFKLGVRTRAKREPWQDAKYIAHAANAYPKLVEALQKIIAVPEVARMAKGTDAMRVAHELLRELGEEKP